jgi:hypothetical protein
MLNPTMPTKACVWHLPRDFVAAFFSVVNGYGKPYALRVGDNGGVYGDDFA